MYKAYQDVWVQDDHPSIELSAEDLAALAIFFGMEVKDPKQELVPRGRGAFGFLLSSYRVKATTVLRIEYGSQSRVGGLT